MKPQPIYPSSARTPSITESSKVTNEIVKTVADYEDASPDQLPPLAERIDSETYQQLVSPDGLTEALSFEYLFYDVTVLPDGEVVVKP